MSANSVNTFYNRSDNQERHEDFTTQETETSSTPCEETKEYVHNYEGCDKHNDVQIKNESDGEDENTVEETQYCPLIEDFFEEENYDQSVCHEESENLDYCENADARENEDSNLQTGQPSCEDGNGSNNDVR